MNGVGNRFMLMVRESMAGMLPVRVGDLVRLGFDMGTDYEGDSLQEKLWVLVTSASDEGFTGKIYEQPLDPYALKLRRNDAVQFNTENVLAHVVALT